MGKDLGVQVVDLIVSRAVGREEATQVRDLRLVKARLWIAGLIVGLDEATKFRSRYVSVLTT